MRALMASADRGIQQLVAIQKTVLGDVPLKKEKPKS